MNLADEINLMTDLFPKKEIFNLSSQLNVFYETKIDKQ
ncbi:MAG: hypothetical protein JWQ78_1529 [Sediminibacterium sp.]|nr:hypothetical protein [Sediminibacterium sp.]